MINHILVPLDGSSLAECALHHVVAISLATDAQITLLHVLEHPRRVTGALAIDPFDWHLRKREAVAYLDRIAARLRAAGLKEVGSVIREGSSADCIIHYASHHNADLIALSTHGFSGLSGWNVSSVVQKVILRSNKSIMLVRAYKTSGADVEGVRYRRLFVGLDGSTRSEYILPFAVNLAKFFDARLTLGTVVRRPEVLDRLPLSDDDQALIDGLVDRNCRAVSHYFEQITSQFSPQGVDLQTRMVVSDDMTAALHDMVDGEQVDLSLLVAHGSSGTDRWPFGSVATSFIAYGSTPLLIMQDLLSEEIKQTQAELVIKEAKGH